MKKLFISAAALVCGLTLAAQDNYTLRVLTFEDEDYKAGTNFAGGNDWSSLIDEPQYGGHMLYGENGYGVSDIDDAYYWYDENNTYLFNRLSEGYGTWCYWSGGHAISNYGSSDLESYGTFMEQLTVFNLNATDEITRQGHGHNGSNNFAVHFGYADDSGYGLGEESLPYLLFNDNTPRVIDHMYVNSTCYAGNCYLNGNGLTASIGEGDWVKITAKGYDIDGNNTGETEIYLCNGPEEFINEWTKFDLYSLGEVYKVTFNISGSSDNGYGFSQPAYFAYDDVAVRFPNPGTGIGELTESTETAEDAIYDISGRKYTSKENLRPGLYIINGRKQVVK